ncbi:hydroxyisourate hydrolase [Streptomyces meridianus]|uniref:5-hydroxyisourate hydrolase n=1 Tax=Streptomyces meridianus TaxID=2938945 RepID=A0ABT0X299_9ACTN|nr:hydroxyisourate hydrolase [Streptomyces meridianus]MCM2576654.1 hydroxyisourate hydrolase [Streptomyces meridianus]
MTSPRPTSVSTHILDTGLGRPAAGVAVSLSVRSGPGGTWHEHGASVTDADGRCKDLPALAEGTTHARLEFATEAYFAGRTAGQGGSADAGSSGEGAVCFFPEVAITFAVDPGEHYHVPLLLSPFGYSVYRGS